MTSNNEKNTERKDSAIQESIGKLLSSKLNVPVIAIDKSTINKVFDALKQVPELKAKLSDKELYSEVSEFVTRLTVFPPKNEKELKNRFMEFAEDLEKVKQCEAVILLQGLIDLPVGTRIGCLEIIEEDKSKKELLDHIKRLEEKRKIYPQTCSWGRVTFKSYRRTRIQEVLFTKLELPCGVLSLIMDMDLDVRDLAGAIYSEDRKRIYFLEPQGEPRGWSKYVSCIVGKYMNVLSAITQKAKPTKLENKILQAIQIFWLSRLSHKTKIRFLMLISAFESLLLTENDRDYLGKKLAEKTTFLLEKDREKRIELYKLMKKYYRKRSGLVHGGNANIEEVDERRAEGIFKRLVFTLLELTAKYDRMEQRTSKEDKPGLEDYINELKFS